MSVMKSVAKSCGLLMLGVGIYIFCLNDQNSDIDEVYSLFPEGAAPGDWKGIEDRYSVKPMGPVEVPDKPGVEQVIFCAYLTMCDTSCNIEYQDKKVTKSGVSKL